MTQARTERLFISAVLRQQDHVTPLVEGVKPAWFHAHRDEWEWIDRYISRHRHTPSKALFKSTWPDCQLVQCDDVQYTLDELRSAHMQQELVRLAQSMVEGIRHDEDPAKVLEDTHRALVGLQLDVSTTKNETDIISDWHVPFDEVVRRVERADQSGMAGVPTGFPTLDMNTGGPQPGEFWVLAARLGQGKTWSLVRMAAYAYASGHTVQYNTLEQSRTQIAMRVHSFLSLQYWKEQFSAASLSRGQGVDLIEYRKFLEDLAGQAADRFIVNDTSRGRLSPQHLSAQYIRNRPSIGFLDYLTLMNPQGADWRDTADLSASIKGVAMDLEIPIVAAAQISRTAVGHEMPGPEHLAQSDAIGQDADAVITMTQKSPRVVKMKLAKYRHGQDGFEWWCEFAPNTGRFVEISGDLAKDLIDEDRVAAQGGQTS